jgi:hypothetical protein
VERKPREDKVGEGGVRDPLRDASGPQPIAASDQSPDRYHFPFDIDSGREAIGVIIRDYTGQFVAARNMFSPHVVDAPMAEAYAFREGLVLAQTIGSNNFIIQTDCMQVVDTMKNGSFSS